jgi:hypothetical protein
MEEHRRPMHCFCICPARLGGLLCASLTKLMQEPLPPPPPDLPGKCKWRALVARHVKDIQSAQSHTAIKSHSHYSNLGTDHYPTALCISVRRRPQSRSRGWNLTWAVGYCGRPEQPTQGPSFAKGHFDTDDFTQPCQTACSKYGVTVFISTYCA